MAADIITRALISLKADTKQARKDLKKLSGEQKRNAKQVVQSLEQQNSKLEDSIEKWGKVTAVVAGTTVAFKALMVAGDKLAQHQNRVAASLGADYQAIAKATTGLITETQALDLAARTAGGTFRTTADEMQLAAKAAVILAQKQGTVEEALDKVASALQEGNIEPLKQYGIIIDAQSDTIEGYNAVVDAMNQLLIENADFSFRAGAATQRAGNQWQNALDELVRSLGKIGQALAPVVQAMAGLAAHLARIVSLIPTELIGAAGTGLGFLSKVNPITGIGGVLADEFGLFDGPGDFGAVRQRGRRVAAGAAGFNTSFAQFERQAIRRGVGAARGFLGGLFSFDRDPRKKRDPSQIIDQAGTGALGNVRLGGFDSRLGNFAGTDFNRRTGLAQFDADKVGRTDFGVGLGVLQGESGNRALKQINSMRTDALIAGQAFTTLGNNAAVAFEQIGASAGRVGEILKTMLRKSIADEVRALASKEFAKAAASATTLNFGMAALHFAAGAGLSAAAGAIEGGRPVRGSGGRGGGSLPGAARGAVGARAGGRTETIIVAHSPFDDDPRGARDRFNDLLDRADQQSARGGGIVRA